MDFALSADARRARERFRRFARERMLPYDTTPESFDEHDNLREDLLQALRSEAKEAGVWAPQMALARGGQGLPPTTLAACYEELNYTLFGPVACNCAAPDDGT